MKDIEYDASRPGLGAVLRDWQIKAIQFVWSNPKGANSRTVWVNVNQMLGDETISRASVINFLESMRGMGILDAEEQTGKGGRFYLYKMGMDEPSFVRYIVSTLLQRLNENFPEETREAVRKILDEK